MAEYKNTFPNKISQYGNFEVAKYLLIEHCGIILAQLDNEDKLFKCAYDYLFKGCKDRKSYEYLVTNVFNHQYDEWCKDVLLNKGE